MADAVTYELDEGIALVTLDDGKANALSLTTLSALSDALARAGEDGATVILTGRPGLLSAGFDLRALTGGGTTAADMLRAGFELAHALLSFPRPVVVACPGHAVAMGSFLLLCGDVRIGADGPFRIVANEVALGMTMPRAAVEVLRQRLTPAALQRATVLAATFSPTEAVAAGWLDQVVEPDRVLAVARETAAACAALDARAHAATKLRLRAATLAALRQAIEDDDVEVRALLADAPG